MSTSIKHKHWLADCERKMDRNPPAGERRTEKLLAVEYELVGKYSDPGDDDYSIMLLPLESSFHRTALILLDFEVSCCETDSISPVDR